MLARLEHERDRSVTALLHHRPPGTATLMADAAGARGLPMQAVAREVHADYADELREARLQLSHIVGVLRSAGHQARDELIAGSFGRTLLHEVSDRLPVAIVLVTSPHRLAHRAHLDVERRLRRHTSVPVDVVMDVRAPLPS